ncbi:gas vesicle protein [Streptomyces sp. ME18-1-4]|uniref:gas vesicle protein GvpO n=1 Tax=Streptomyces sp. ME18-1-4 TaxID=3028685 RepID=UPI0029A24F9F|nr:gas vesicle protein [Streptomyces sp. ME18-1-4]MDX3242023.1 gas vesicle protein [Streptomyces sp. ME18-1-4]
MSNTRSTSDSTKNTSDARTSRNTRKSGPENDRPKHHRVENDSDEKGKDHVVADDRPRPVEVLREARAQLAELTGMTAESVSSFAQTEDGWSLDVEVLELERVPDTMSLMATYQVELDPEGQLTGYRRVRRYERGRADAHRSGGR